MNQRPAHPSPSPSGTTPEAVPAAALPAERPFYRRALPLGAMFVAALLLAPTLASAQQAVPSAEPAPGRIVYSREEQAEFDLWLSDPDGSNETRLAEVDESEAGEDHPRWSPDGERIIFETTRKGDGLIALRVLPYTGGEPELLIEDVGLRGGEPAWHPEGECIAFAGGHQPMDVATDLKTMCIGDEQPTTITPTGDVDERMPSWHPDGDQLAFVARPIVVGDDEEAFWSLWRMNADGSGREMLLDVPQMSVRYPRYSPDGTQIAVIIAQGDYDFGTLSLFDVEQRTVTPLVDRPAGPFAWSPEGDALLFNNISERGLVVHGRTEPITIEGQAKGLYRLQLEDMALSRLSGKAGGIDARRFDFGYAPDWTAGTATPTPTATATPTVTPTPLVTNTPTATVTPEASPTPERDPNIYLPRLFNGDEAPPTATVEPTSATAEATGAPTAPVTPAPPTPGPPTAEP